MALSKQRATESARQGLVQSPPAKGETMTTTAMATYAYDQIDWARAELKAVSK
jgi:hypothetical protein